MSKYQDSVVPSSPFKNSVISRQMSEAQITNSFRRSSDPTITTPHISLEAKAEL